LDMLTRGLNYIAYIQRRNFTQSGALLPES